MTNEPNQERIDSIRRKLLRASAVIGGGLALGHLPYQRPAVKSFFGVRSAWAQPSVRVLPTCGTAVVTAAPPPSDGEKTASFTIENTGSVPFTVTGIKSSNLDFKVLNPAVLPKLDPKDKVRVDMVVSCLATGIAGIQSTTVTVETTSPSGPASCAGVDLSVDCGSE